MLNSNEPLGKQDLLPHATELRRTIARWQNELAEVDPIRSTLWYGIMVKSSIEVERLLLGCLSALLPVSGARGLEIVRLSARRPDRPTFGEIVRALKAIVPIVAATLEMAPLTHDAHVYKALDALVRIRNTFVHGGQRENGTAAAVQFLQAADAACAWDLVPAVARACRNDQA